ncbi:PREDICTED: uncharacterized protein LOC105460408, partial [Wasmannia auropunctata]|uniref:uncharacterized protein LOC105460408 n=1 Tax=Wasmannia auropunctata TaxID=64793 RepID=UPI0005EDEBB8
EKENKSIVPLATEKNEFIKSNDKVISKLSVHEIVDTNTTSTSAMPKKSSVKTVKKIMRSQPIFDSKAIYNFGSKTLTGEEMARCKHQNKVSTLALDLFALLFTKKEMALGNLTGKAPQGYKNIT